MRWYNFSLSRSCAKAPYLDLQQVSQVQVEVLEEAAVLVRAEVSPVESS